MIDTETPVPTGRRQRVYIAGPMRGLHYYNFPAFDHARDALLAVGYDVISPADLDREAGFDPARDCPVNQDWHACPGGFDMRAAFARDVAALARADYILLLPGWIGSRGASAEMAMARAMQIPDLWLAGINEDAARPIDEQLRALITTATGALRYALSLGAGKHPSFSYRDEPRQEHLLKAVRHAATCQLQVMKKTPDDGEDHLALAICRLTMMADARKGNEP